MLLWGFREIRSNDFGVVELYCRDNRESDTGRIGLHLTSTRRSLLLEIDKFLICSPSIISLAVDQADDKKI